VIYELDETSRYLRNFTLHGGPSVVLVLRYGHCAVTLQIR
jgi:hypothetical protein